MSASCMGLEKSMKNGDFEVKFEKEEFFLLQIIFKGITKLLYNYNKLVAKI
jgi:hypothetical protein